MGGKKTLPSWKLAARSFGTQYTLDERDSSQELEWMQLEEQSLGSAATGGVRLCTDDTTLIERVEPCPSHQVKRLLHVSCGVVRET